MSPPGRRPARVSASSNSRSLPDSRHLARRRLDSVCRRDPEFPAAVVWTIYYDTPAFASLGEKINSDYLKRKIRVRWYSDLEGRVSVRRSSKPSCAWARGARKCARSFPIPPKRSPVGISRIRGCGASPLLLREQGILHQGVVAADDADSLSPRSLHRAAHPIRA